MRRTHSSARVHLARTGTLLACTTLASLLALFPYEPPADEPGRSALAAAGAAISVTLVGLGVIALLNRKVPLKPGRGRQRTGVVRRVDPYPGEIWWGMVDFRDGDGAKDRPFLIVNVYDGCAVILQITTKDKTHRRDHVRFTTASMDPDGMDRRLEMRPRTVSLSDFRKPHHLACPPRTWRLVQAQFGSRAAS